MRFAPIREWPRATQAAAIALLAALLFNVVLVVRILRGPALEPVVEPLASLRIPVMSARVSADGELVRQAADRTQFDLVAPSGPTQQLAANSTFNMPALVRRPRLIGTVIEGQSGFVMVEMPDARMQVVRIGERAGDLRLRSITAGEAVFDDNNGKKVTLRSNTQSPDSRP